MAENRTTLQAIADALGISKVTVSRALKGQSGVSEDLRRRVQDLSRDMGYMKEKLRTEAKTLRFAFVTPTRYFLATDNFYQTIYYHLNDLCHEASLDLSVFVIPPDEEAGAKLPPRLCAEEPDGVFLGGEMGETFIKGLVEIGAPLVSIDFAGLRESVDSVVVDNFRLGEAAARYLLGRGYKRIGFVGGRAYSSNVADRYYGYRKVLDQAGLPPEEAWLIDNADHSTGHYTLDFPLPPVMPEAFVCHCDRAAYYAIQRLRSEGFRVPEDVAMVSFDNTELASSCQPTLTSFDISKKRFADEAFHLMRERLDGYSGSARRVYLESAIVERESAPLAAAP
jgi:LacI family transcriptional regulator